MPLVQPLIEMSRDARAGTRNRAMTWLAMSTPAVSAAAQAPSAYRKYAAVGSFPVVEELIPVPAAPRAIVKMITEPIRLERDLLSGSKTLVNPWAHAIPTRQAATQKISNPCTVTGVQRRSSTPVSSAVPAPASQVVATVRVAAAP